MNIAYISAVFPYPLHSGGQVRVYNLLKRLSKLHDITLFAFVRSKSEEKYVSELTFCKKVIPIYRGRAWKMKYLLRTILSRWSFLYATYENGELNNLLSMNKDHFDLIHIEPGYVIPSIPSTSTPLVVAEHNIEHSVYEGYVNTFPFVPLRPILQLDVNKMKRSESETWNTASSVIAVSNDDAVVIQKKSNQKKVHVVPNGADLEYFAFSPKKIIDKNSLQFIYVGNFAWMQNTDAIEHTLRTIWPSILGKYPNATFTIVGKHFPRSLRVNLHPTVRILESVSDIRSAYSQADALLAPIRIGGGTRYKIIEAMASGLPVITSTLGASGLSVKHESEVYIADTALDVLHCIDNLLSDSKRKKLVERARKCIESSYSWEKIAKLQDACWRIYEKK